VPIAALVTAVAFFTVLVATVKPLGTYIDDVFAGRPTLLQRFAGPVERFVYRLCHIDPALEMSWQRYTGALLAVSAMSVALTYVALRVQAWLPFNPQRFGNLAPISLGTPP